MKKAKRSGAKVPATLGGKKSRVVRKKSATTKASSAKMAFIAAMPRAVTFECAQASTAMAVRVTLVDEGNRVIVDTRNGVSRGQSSPRPNGSPVSVGVDVLGTPPQAGVVTVTNGLPQTLTVEVPSGTTAVRTFTVLANW